MKLCSLLLALWVPCLSVTCQPLYPGGVAAPFLWYTTDSSSATPALHALLPGTANIVADHGGLSQLNFHPSLVVDGGASLQVPLGARDLHDASYFTVYQSLDTTSEHAIWHIANGQQATLVLTTGRMADLLTHKYMNYTDLVPAQPKVNSYFQHKKRDSLPPADQWWNIGATPVAPALPVPAFKGLIAEIIAYPRVLSSRERLRVASYLSLKYGITLTEPGATYLNSAGQPVWDGYDYAAWHHDIAGICRDDSAGLNQPSACSSNAPGLMTMTTYGPLSNNAYLLWGDNARPLTPAPKTAGLPLMLQKTWLMKPYGGVTPFSTSLIFDTRAVDAPLPAQPVYWLVIDPGGQGKFSTASTFIRMDQLDEQGRAYFDHLVWDSDGSGKDVWGMIVARDLLLVTDIDQPDCAGPASGGMHMKIIGGQAPYQLTVTGSNGFLASRQLTGNQNTTDLTGLSFGKYFLAVTDAQGRMYKDSLYLNNADAPLPSSLSASYLLPPGGTLQLDAAENMPDGLTWQWTGPGNFESLSPQVTITTPGLYSLTCSKDGCGTEQDITVTGSHNNALYDVTVYPNPSPAAFTARVNLDDPAAVTMSVYAQDGRLVAVQSGEGRSNYYFSGTLATAGVYELVFVSGLSATTKRIIITKE